MPEQLEMHQYLSDGASLDPSCKVCGRDSWDNKICFESKWALNAAKRIKELENRDAKQS